MKAEDFVDHIENCMEPVDGVVVAQEGQIDVPETWVLKRTDYVAGKRIRIYELR